MEILGEDVSKMDGEEKGTTVKKRTACFTGHRFIDHAELSALQNRLEHLLIKLIGQGVVFFGCGGAFGFDMLAGFCVLKLKEKHPQIKLILVLPCPEQAERWSAHDRAEYKRLLAGADKLVYIAQHYYDGCELDRNRHLINHSGVCVSYLKYRRSGTGFTVRIAREQGLTVFNLAE